MTYGTILTVVDATGSDQQIHSAIRIAREMEAHLAILLIVLTPSPPVYDYGFISIAGSWQVDMQAGAEKLAARAKDVSALLQKAEISGDVTTAYCNAALVEPIVARRAMMCDLAYFSNPAAESDFFAWMLSGVLFKSPVAAIVDRKADGLAMFPKRVFVAWNTSLEAASSIHRALPILKRAEEVTVGIFDPVMAEYNDGEDPGTDVAAWLSHHGCKVNVQQYPSGGKGIAVNIRQRAAEIGADLVVMGAYGHSRLTQRVFGGTTRSMLEQSDLPVFLGH